MSKLPQIPQIEEAIREIQKMMTARIPPKVRQELKDIIYLLEDGIVTAREALIEAENIGVRNPAFEGDMVGYPDDDFDKWDD